MAYKTYITDALVCGAFDNNTSDRSFLLFTREAGMLYASARSVREERSKQRYALQECSYVRTTLVRGKSGWKITGAEPIVNAYASAQTREARAFIRNTILLLRRVMHGEIAHEGIFDDVREVTMRAHEGMHSACECVLSLRILHALGYIAPVSPYVPFLHGAFPYAHVDTLADDVLDACRHAIASALTHSHL